MKNSILKKCAALLALTVSVTFPLEACTKAPDSSDDTTLKTLAVSSGTLSPSFAAEFTEYTVEVDYSVTDITITAETNHAGATLSGVGTHPLAVGENRFTATVTAEDGVTKLNYTVTVFRAQPPVEDPTGITMTTQASDVWITVTGAKDIAIDWGDGNRSNVNDASTNGPSSFRFSHDYSGSTARTIVITGNVERLNVKNNQLTDLGVSRCTTLKSLDCSNNQLTALDVSRNTALTGLSCHNNPLTALDVSRNTVLKHLSFGGNQLTAMDVSRNTELLYLYCMKTQITNLDVSLNTALTNLYCMDNPITNIDVSRNTALYHLEVCGNQLTSLDVSANTSLKDLCVRYNQLTTSALNDLFRTLPEMKYGNIEIRDNPGTHDCDFSIAEKKGWQHDSFHWGEDRNIDDF